MSSNKKIERTKLNIPYEMPIRKHKIMGAEENGLISIPIPGSVPPADWNNAANSPSNAVATSLKVEFRLVARCFKIGAIFSFTS